MAQIDFLHITNEWIKITVPDEGETYLLQNRGADVLVALESDTFPEEDNQEGTYILPYIEAEYKKGEQDLYLRAFNKSCSVNICSKESGGFNL